MKRVVGVLLGAMLPVALASAQIQYTIDGGTPVALPSSRIINVGTLTNPITTLHIFDSNGVDDSIVGQVEIQGTATSETSLRIKIVNQNDTSTFVLDQNVPLAFGLRDFGGLTFSNTSLRDRSVVAVSIQGDITGDIDAGQIWRIDALSDENGSFGGHINGNITSFKVDNAVITDAPSIGFVRASYGITGNIVASSSTTFDSTNANTYASISRIIVGPSLDSGVVGIQGDIKAEHGKIGSIWTTGPIGSVGNTKKIYAANGIYEVLAIGSLGGSIDPSSEFLVRDFVADVQANRDMLDANGNLRSGYQWRGAGGVVHL